ncbi:DUF3644 domain-containing protein [bacterium]|nr:DUF3644 domain-containing protein [bacterium]
MSRGKKTKTKKIDLVRELAAQLGIIPEENNWFSEKGSTIQARAIEALLEKIAQRTGIPPSHFAEYQKEEMRLILKSMDAMILAIETVNKPAIRHRIESFLLLSINAWELLLKARVVHDRQDKKAICESNDSTHTKTFTWVLQEAFPKPNNAIRKNLELIKDFRDSSAHLYLLSLPSDILLTFQACILNYEEKLREWFDRSLCEIIPEGMMFLVVDLAPRQINPSSHKPLSSSITQETYDFLETLKTRIQGDLEIIDEEKIANYAIPIDLSLSVINNPKKADILARLSKGEDENQGIYVIKDRNPIDRYPYSYRKVWETVKKSCPGIKQSDLNKIIKEHEIKKNTNYSTYNFRTKEHKDHYDNTGELPTSTTSIYNKQCIEFIVKVYKQKYVN